nr:hypothetical protein [Micromonospora sp. DSM 115978]
MDSSELTYRDDVREFAVEIVELVFPSGTGYTLRTYPDADAAGASGDAAFLAHEGRLLLFRTPAGLARFLGGDDEHDLTGLPGWRDRAADLVPPALIESAAVEPTGSTSAERDTPAESDDSATPDGPAGTDAEAGPGELVDGEDEAGSGGEPASAGRAEDEPTDAPPDGVTRFEFDLVPTNLAGSPDQWIPELLLPARNLTAELAQALHLRRIQAALAEGQYLDRFDDALRAATGAGTFSLARRRLRGFESSRLATQWRQLIRWLEQAVRWED